MKIGIDARPLQDGNSTRGIGSYLSQLLAVLLKLQDDNYYTLFFSSGNKIPIDFSHERFGIVRLKKGNSKRELLYSQALNIDQYMLDVFLQTDVSNHVATATTPVVAVAYDLIPLHFSKEEFNTIPHTKKGVNQYKAKLLNFLRHKKYQQGLIQYQKADRLIAISEATKEDFIKELHIKNPIDVVLLAGNETTPAGGASKADKEDYLLYVGANEDRKNISLLIDALAELLPKHPSLKLYLVGYNFGDQANQHTIRLQNRIVELKVEGSVVFKGFVDDVEKLKLYYSAKAFVFPSLYEGFGLPILEAMQAGCPVVALRNSSIPEVVGDAAILAKNDAEFIDGIEELLVDGKKRNELIKRGLAQASKFSWEDTAKQTLKVLKRVAEAGKQV